MRKLAMIVLCAFMAVNVMFAQRAATSTVDSFKVTGGKYSFDIWARNTGSVPLIMGTSSFYLTYDSSALTAAVLSNVNPRFTKGAGTDYDSMTVEHVAGRIAVTVRFAGPGGGDTIVTAAPNGERICTVTLDVTNASAFANLAWDTLNSAITAPGLNVENTFTGGDASPLPIQLVSFTAAFVSLNHVTLAWTTASELNNYGYYVQRSATNNGTFTDIPGSFQPGHGTTSEEHNYTYADTTAGTGDWYYRLRQVDLDNTVHYSEAIRPSGLNDVAEARKGLPTEFALDQNYPNPFNPSTIIQFALPRETRVSLDVYNLLGQKVASLADEVMPAGYHQVSFNASHLASGVYFYRLNAGTASFLKKMMIVK